jgi:hypothetical protein
MLLQINHVTITDTFPLYGTNRGDFWINDGTGTGIMANDMSTGNGADSCVFQVGHTYTSVRGIGRYTYGRYRIMPRDKNDLINTNGTISGTVFGPDGITPLSGVTITTYDAADNVVGSNISGPSGEWVWNNGSDGVYHEVLHKAGYIDTSITDIVVYGDQTTNVSTLMRVQEVFCTGNNIFTIKFASVPGTEPDCWPSPRAGQVDSVCGIITAVKQGTSNRYFIQDQGHTAWGAVYGYDFTLPDATPVLPVLGDYVQVKSRVAEYYGWTELDSLISYAVISSNQPLPDTPVVTVSMFTPNTCNYIAEPYESELVRFNNVTVRSAQGTLGNYWVTDPSTGDSIRIATDLWYAGTDQPNPLPSPGFVYSSIVGVIRWEGRTSGSNIRGWILLPRFASDYTLMPAPELVYVYPVDETKLAVTFNRGMNPASITNPANYSTFNGLSIISGVVDPPGTLWPRKVILTTSAQPGNTMDTLIASGLCDSMGVCMLTPRSKMFHSGFTTISYIQTPNAGGDSSIWVDHIFTIKAVCVSDSIYGHYNNYFLVDQSGPPYRGIHVYFGSFLPRPPMGDTAIMTGHCVEYSRETELQDFSWFNNVQILGHGPNPEPTKVTTGELWAHPEYYESDLVTVCDTFTITRASIVNYGWLIQSTTNPVDTLTVNKDGYWTRYTYAPVLGNTIRGITGVYRFARSSWRISPRLDDDFNSFDTWCVERNPIIGVDPSSITHFQETEINRNYAADFTINNTGNGALDFTAGTTLPWITVGTPIGSVPAGGSLSIDLNVNTIGVAVGTYSDNILISSNDPTTPSVTLPVTVVVSLVAPDADHFDVTITAGNDTSVVLNIGNGALVDVRVDLVAAPSDWLSVDPTFAVIPSGGSVPFLITVNATSLNEGTYNGLITITSGNLATGIIEIPIVVDVEPGGPQCDYIPGNVNSVGGFTGLDVVYAVAYLKGGPPPGCPCECTPGHIWYVCGDVNASCTFTGLDVTYMVAYLKGGPALQPCPDCPPIAVTQSIPGNPQGQ